MNTVNRRSFLTILGVGLCAPAILRARRGAKRLPIAFSTLGCPDWSWKTILEAADRLGYGGIELRGVAGEMDLPKVPEFQGTRLAATRADLAALGIVITDLGASAHMHEKDGAARERQFDEGRRFIDVAQALGVPYVRMFGDAIPPGEPKEGVMKRIVDGFQRMAAHAKPAGVTVLIESHGDFTRSSDLAAILTRVGSPQFALLWDAHHTFVAGKEQPAATYAKLGRWIRHTHLKDSKPEGTNRRYVLLGSGEVPVKEQVKVLAAAGYQGYYGLEWEKKWHPEIEDPEVAFPQYAKAMDEYLAEAGVKPGSTKAARLPHRTLGRTGVQVSILAFGCGSRFLMYPQEQASAVLEQAIDSGIDYFDTAMDYGNGESETRVGRVMATRRNDVFLATKVPPRSRTRDAALRAVEASLRRLQTDHLDLLHLHGLGDDADLAKIEGPDGALKALYELRDQKVTRFIGMSCHADGAVMAKAIERNDLDCVQMAMNPVRGGRFEELALPAANRKNLGVILMKVTAQDKLLVDGGADTASLLRYAWSLPISTAVCGMPKLEFLEANVATAKAYTSPLPAAEMERLRKQLAARRFALEQFFSRHQDRGWSV